MKITRTMVFAASLGITSGWTIAEHIARAEDSASAEKSRIDDRANHEKDQIDVNAKIEKARVDERAEAAKDDVDRRQKANTSATKTGGTKDSASDQVTDSWITTKVKASFVGEKGLKGADIHVVTEHNGVVVLTGSVPNEQARTLAVALARDTKGVHKVEDKMVMKAAK